MAEGGARRRHARWQSPVSARAGWPTKAGLRPRRPRYSRASAATDDLPLTGSARTRARCGLRSPARGVQDAAVQGRPARSQLPLQSRAIAAMAHATQATQDHQQATRQRRPSGRRARTRAAGHVTGAAGAVLGRHRAGVWPAAPPTCRCALAKSSVGPKRRATIERAGALLKSMRETAGLTAQELGPRDQPARRDACSKQAESGRIVLPVRDHPAAGGRARPARPGGVRDESHALLQPGAVEGARGPRRRSPGGARRPRARVRQHLPCAATRRGGSATSSSRACWPSSRRPSNSR